MSRWISTEMDDEEKLDVMMPMPMDRPDYCPGMCLSFNSMMVKKVGLEELPAVGDILDMRCFMEVTHVSDGPAGQCFEVQITQILNPVENENTEMDGGDEEAGEPPVRRRRGALYG